MFCGSTPDQFFENHVLEKTELLDDISLYIWRVCRGTFAVLLAICDRGFLGRNLTPFPKCCWILGISYSIE